MTSIFVVTNQLLEITKKIKPGPPGCDIIDLDVGSIMICSPGDVSRANTLLIEIVLNVKDMQ